MMSVVVVCRYFQDGAINDEGVFVAVRAVLVGERSAHGRRFGSVNGRVRLAVY